VVSRFIKLTSTKCEPRK